MLATVRSATVVGIDALEVLVEVDVATGLPQWSLVGLAATSVKESRERVAAALANAGFVVPPRRITVNLSPAALRKEGTAFDLPIALGVLVATGQLPAAALEQVVAVGELGLDGSVRAVRGVLPIARAMRAADAGRTLVLPEGNAGEAGLVRDLRVHAPPSLGALVTALRAGVLPPPPPVPLVAPLEADTDLAEVAGQPAARRALEIAAAGGHNLLLVGAPGAGKTMLARRLPSILPPLDEDEALEVISIHSVAGLLDAGRAASRRPPFRAPHHTTSSAGLIGGGTAPRPGEVSLAHRGVLFVDELLELPRSVLDVLRQPLEDGTVTISRAHSAVTYPARFTLVAATNPCPCGHAAPSSDATSACVCAPADVARYRARLSGPLADRIDLHVSVARVPPALLGRLAPAESSATVRERVVAARALQRTRYQGLAVRCNAHAPASLLEQRGAVTDDARRLLASAAERLALSARSYHRVLRVARTIADLAGARAVDVGAVAEALRYRPVGEAAGGATVRAASA